MNSRLLSLSMVGVVLSVAACRIPEARRPPRPPNIVLFLVDDLGWQDTSLAIGSRPTPQNAHFATPRLEELAARGVTFTDAYACAVCSPTRTSWITGQNAARHRVTQWTLEPGRDQSARRGRLASPAAWRVDGLQPGGVDTLPDLLRERGYRTIHVGKAHWGARGTAGEDPRELGFDINVAGHAAGAPGSYSAANGFGAANSQWAVKGLDAWHGRDAHLTDVLTTEALGHVDAAVATRVPFFLYLAHYAVHTPIEEHPPHAAAYRAAGVDERESRYASMVAGVDASLGAVLDRLRALGVADDTIVMFCSDNGGLSVHARGAVPAGVPAGRHNAPLRAGKGSAYEGGTRVPVVVACAGDGGGASQAAMPTIEAGSRCAEPIIVEDWYPTLLRWAGVETTARQPIDGHDLTPWLTPSKSAAAAARPLLFHYPHWWGPKGDGYEPHSAMRLGSDKVVYFYEPRRWELYDLARDLEEAHDIGPLHPQRLRALAERMLRELDARGAQYPTVRGEEGTAWPAERPILPP